jgi:hypothetical protein
MSGPRFHYTSEWVLIARKADYFAPVRAAHAKLPPPPRMPEEAFLLHLTEIHANLIWKDGGSNSLAAVRR